MTKQEYLDKMMKYPKDEGRIKNISEMYNTPIGDVAEKVISFADNADFIAEERRAFSFKEIENASKEYDRNFQSMGIIPLFDAYDNDLIVYVVAEKVWAKYSLSDDVIFKKRNTLAELL
ncbi:hypothetical protein [Ruminococcus sp. FC2018]|uniref:hypothetical protein n=1 Tax=Ruminococcus sp. FC2018 TaxID=1410617 RepID=UPI00048B9CD5|nr:hypothetical protein [Ruminococcus sp. FC2018]